MEDIEQMYTGISTQEKLKQCLYSLFKTRGLKYVLLGGDDSVVPVRYCKNKCSVYTEDKMPTDLYYACFAGRFDWDANGNGIYGEPSDSIDLMPSIYLSRLPIRTISEAENYSKNVVSYEMMTGDKVWNKKILMCGSILSENKDGHSDSELKGDKLYREAIKDLWNGERKKLYDTYNDFGYSNLSNKAIQEQITTGYAFADFITHGSYSSFSSGAYNVNDASAQTNAGYTIITTMACHTNAFDKELCLSESFIRNQNSGILAYLGSSRYGWYYGGSNFENTFGSSLQYEKEFYDYIFSDKIKDKNFAKIVAATKISKIGSSCSDNGLRWLQFGLNPVGDPEMPIYTDNPKKLPMTKAKIEKSILNIDTGVDSCTVCVMSRLDGGNSYYRVLHNVRTASFDYNVDSLSLCITKQNYKPMVINDVLSYCRLTNPSVSDGLIIGAGKDFDNGDITIKYHVVDNSRKASIVISSYDGTDSRTFDAPVSEDKIRVHSSLVSKDILSISLIVDSKLSDSITFNNK